MTKLNVHPGIDHGYEVKGTHAGMAYFSSTGPIGMICGDCGHYWRGTCLKFVEMTKQKPVRFPRDAMSCKYLMTDKYEISKPVKLATEPLFQDLPTQRKTDAVT